MGDLRPDPLDDPRGWFDPAWRSSPDKDASTRLSTSTPEERIASLERKVAQLQRTFDRLEGHPKEEVRPTGGAAPYRDLQDGLAEPSGDERTATSTASLVRIQAATVRRESREILRIDDLTIAQGEHIAILGPNGAGKSTLLRLLGREIHPHGGRGFVEILGRRDLTQVEARRTLGMADEAAFRAIEHDPTVAEIALSGREGTLGIVRDAIDPERILAQVGLAHLAERRFSTLSAGERRRAVVARALAAEPAGLVLDEPTSAMDPGARRRFLALLPSLSERHTILLVTHHPEEVLPLFGRVLHLKEGRIVFDGPREGGLAPERMDQLFDGQTTP